MNAKSWWWLIGCWLVSFTHVQGQEIGFVEDFALAADRQQVLSRLVPGTDEFYYYHALHYQHQLQLDEVDTLYREWINRLGRTARAQQIKRRQALLRYSDNPQQTLDYLVHNLGLRFDYQREIPDAERDLPSQLDQQQISFAAFAQRALAHNNHTDGFHESALYQLAQQELDPDRLRHLLQRLRYPDVPNLVALVARDLQRDDRPSFGYLSIHRLMTIDQLDALASQLPELRQQSGFVFTYLSKLSPSDDAASFRDDATHREYLERIWAFAKDLDPVFNSLKAGILLQRLSLDRRSGEFDKERFLNYLQLPKHVFYIRPERLRQFRDASHYAQLGSDFREFSRLIPIPNDEPIVRYFLMHYLRDAANADEFAPYVADEYLRPVFAEVKITTGQGDPQQWASWLTPEAYRELMQRVDLDFDPTLPRQFPLDQPVTIKLTTKNVSTLIVKVFEINTGAYYRLMQREIDTDLNIDGLVPHWEKTYQYDDPPLRRVEREFSFDQLQGPGVWVIDFIGNGKSSRALIRKGELQHLVETTVAGQMFTIHDGDGTRVTDASLWVAGREYHPLPTGEIVVPFSTQPGWQAAIISRGAFSSLIWFQHEAESYQLDAGFHVDREALVRGRRAQLVIRPQLYLNGLPVTNELLKDWRMQIVAVDGDGLPATIDVPQVEWSKQQELQYEFQVPGDLRTLSATLTAQVPSVSETKDIPLSASMSLTVNQINDTASIRDLHLLPTVDGFVLELRGKTGEPLPRQIVQLTIAHRLFRDPFGIALQADAQGLIHLGPLSDIASVQAQIAGTDSRDWQLQTRAQVPYESYHVLENTTLAMPFATVGDAPRREDFALFEMRGENPIADRFDALAFQPGRLAIRGLHAGDYQLVIKATDQSVRIRVTAGRADGAWLLGQQRVLEQRQAQPLFIAAINEREKDIEIQLAGNGAGARVHVLASRYWPRFDAFAALNQIRDAEPLLLTRGWQSSAYLAGRDIGDEYRYILDRKYEQKFPGNVLDRPSLILQPWSRQTTDSTVQHAAEGGEFGQAGGGAVGGGRRDRAPGGVGAGRVDPSSLDFLADGSVTFWNLAPDAEGRVVLSKEHLDDRHYLTVIVVNDHSTQRRTLTLPAHDVHSRDLRLTNGLDPKNHAALTKQLRVVETGDTLIIDDLRAARFQSFSSVADVYLYFQTLTSDATINEFHFVADWGTKTDEEKRELYSKFACHELNVFLAHKDLDFFRQVVVPFLKNKRAPTMIDHWLLEAPLDSYLDPWQFQRLHVGEQLLLARRLPAERAVLIRHVNELYQLNPTSRAAFDRLFDVAVNLRSIRAGDPGSSETASFGIAGIDLERPQSQGRFRGGMGGAGRFGAPGAAAPAAPPADAAMARRSQANNEVEERVRVAEKLDRDGQADKNLREVANESEASKEFFSHGFINTLELDSQSGLLDMRNEQAQLFRRLPPTEEWIETYYYKLPWEQSSANRIAANRFWRDYADHLAAGQEQPFLSPHFPEAASNFTDMMFALAVLDLPFAAPEHVLKIEDDKLQFTAAGPAVVFYQQVQPAPLDPRGAGVLVAENFFRSDDRYRMEGNQRYDKFINDEFLVHVLYGAQVVLTNPTSTPQLVDLLTQIPNGALPAAKSQVTRTRQLELAPFSTQTFEYYFYFPSAGTFTHFPAHASIEQRVVASAAEQSFRVVDTPSQIDRRSWSYLSQHGSDAEVIEFLQTENILAIDLGKIAFRMADREFFRQATDTLRSRKAYQALLWSYAVKHNDSATIAEFLRNSPEFLQQIGPAFESPLVTIDPVDRRWYEHREYWPLVNARAHRLGARRQITNPRIHQQYHQWLEVLACRARLTAEDRLAAVYYLLLQDRVAEAIEHFSAVERDGVAEQMQYDYLAAYLAFSREAVDEAEAIAQRYEDYPHERWRTMFRNVLAQVAEIRGGATAAADARDRQQRQDELAAQAPALDFTIEARKIAIDHRNVSAIEIRYYQMDIELLFSRNPFVQQTTGGFAMIRPNRQDTLELAVDQHRTRIDLPPELHNANVLVEISGGGQVRSRAYYAHSLIVELQENYGQLRVLAEQSGQPLSKVYVKVFARQRDGSVAFYKDGYTDLRGRFDYVSLSNRSLDGIDRFAVLILSDEHGAVIREAGVPKE